MNFSTQVHLNDWREVLEQADLANVFHTPDYFEAQTSPGVGHKLLYMCCYDQRRPVGIIAGYQNTSGYHEGLVEIGTKSGGYPLLTNEYDRRPDADEIKNVFIRRYVEHYLESRPFVFYPCFHMQESDFDRGYSTCARQLDSCAFIDLLKDEDSLWQNLRDKGRNMVRRARRNGVTTRLGGNGELFDRFYDLYRALRQRLNTGYIGYEELRLKYDLFTARGLADFWVAHYENIPIAFNFMWIYKRQLNYIYNASDPEYLKLSPNNLLQWDMIRHYKKHGFETYNLWGLRNMHLSDHVVLDKNHPIEGYGKFKLSLGADVVDLVRFVKLPIDNF
ncbi:MAG: GNAT family N-acetyltransferase [Gammaproteobacteria bacterium]|nr:GNAT family N-acetyltransferase [Gammaproteobacteria bacterium]